ncbi:hypothetical protein Q9R38_14520 [Priestia aryabhattai]|uniref:hypothetical protein n=1 Tax=Priestia aryabhattai TaxID=412384 RepID=UPI002882AD26|nr:hypothetical protein [Priestia aryabhattai]MDT0147729.1 hypothetical protein [Priestia aryabhattai]MDT0154404.1 hypothetical protein [Priestia aryabhattai]MED4000293.1 hypothetical protein [Priestia aryabhattai]
MDLNQLIKLEAPYFHIAVGDTTLLYNLQVQARELNKTEFKVIRGQKCKSVTGLLNEWLLFFNSQITLGKIGLPLTNV